MFCGVLDHQHYLLDVNDPGSYHHSSSRGGQWIVIVTEDCIKVMGLPSLKKKFRARLKQHDSDEFHALYCHHLRVGGIGSGGPPPIWLQGSGGRVWLQGSGGRVWLQGSGSGCRGQEGGSGCRGQEGGSGCRGQEGGSGCRGQEGGSGGGSGRGVRKEGLVTGGLVGRDSLVVGVRGEGLVAGSGSEEFLVLSLLTPASRSQGSSTLCCRCGGRIILCFCFFCRPIIPSADV